MTMICTITPPPDCLARLAACPALPRGERLEWAVLVHPREFCPCCFKRAYNIVNDASCSTLLKQWRSMARPLRDARQKLREARTHARTLEQVCAQQEQRISGLEDKLADLDIGSDCYEERP